MKALLSICLFWGLLSPGAPMSCYQCMGQDCARPGIQKCKPHENACVSSIDETTLVSAYKPEYNLTTRFCAPADICLQSYTSISTVDGGSYRISLSCCYTNLCNDQPVSLPETEDSSPNGVICPACFVFNSAECQEEETINCTGGETKCIEAAVDLYLGHIGDNFTIFLKGCTTPNTCFYPIVHLNHTKAKLNFNVTKRNCTQESSGETGESKSLSSLDSSIPGQGAGSWGSRD